ncbi:DUF4019 domain-containing protein [Vibrio sonorensis]|uniref:DUF4019 domain-containing protein n=1 Tax=Vibrio sonorensis TaxID=1004316 RepID=UPI0008DAEECD|nr:DUF4019 domain-containing protein [Vibrio sonorensis]
MIKQILVASVFLSAVANASDIAEKEAAAWLQVVDSGAYEVSWQQADSHFKEQVPQEKWIQALNQARMPLGTLVSRTKSKEETVVNPPEAPKGEYSVIQYVTDFSSAQKTETVTVTDASGEWKVIGYYINDR